MPNGCNGDCDQTYDYIPYAGNTPTVYPFGSTTPIASFSDHVQFTKHDTFGYSLNGKEVLVAQGGSYALTDDTAKALANGETGYKGTTAVILNGTNGSTGKDFNLRPLTKSVNTGWTPATTGLASDIFTLWGMQDSLATKLVPSGALATNYTYVVPDITHTDTYALSLSYDPASVTADQLQNGLFGLATKDANGNWVSALNGNTAGSLKFVKGAWDASYGLGTYGIDTVNNKAWAVIDHASDFAVAPLNLTDISANVTVKASGTIYNRATQIYNSSVTITNNSATPISGPIAVTLNNLTSGVTLANATGSNNGSPYVAQVVSLNPGASVSVPVQFRNPSNARINFTLTTYQI
jgi:hypothetical protein